MGHERHSASAIAFSGDDNITGTGEFVFKFRLIVRPESIYPVKINMCVADVTSAQEYWPSSSKLIIFSSITIANLQHPSLN